MLVAIKLLHTLVWGFFAGCIVWIPFLAIAGQFRWAMILSGLVLIECGVLAANGFRCPMTNWAARYTADRRANFDIYLPLWLARHNQQIFGWLFVLGEAVLLVCWLRNRFPAD
jgi:hypothetical protein